MKILFFGIYDLDDPTAARTRNILRGIKESGIEVYECNARERSLKRFWILFKKYLKISEYFDFIFVPFSGVQLVMPLAIFFKILGGKKIVIDPMISLYDTMVRDRDIHRKLSLRAIYYYFLDWISFKFADLIILDTYEHIKYISGLFKIPEKKFRRILICKDEENLQPLNIYGTASTVEAGKFKVFFCGYFIPLQGIEYIIKAAKILEQENIVFDIVGKGQEYSKITRLAENLNLKNINFIDAVPYEELGFHMAEADVVLGIFGGEGKALRVIPNKAYDAIAVKKPLITARTPAIKEIFSDRENVLLVNPADEQDLAEKIMELKNNTELRKKIAENGYKLFKEKLNRKALTEELIKILEEELKNDY